MQFPVGQVTLEFQVTVTKSGEGSAGVKAWVIEAGSTASFARETVQTVTVVLEQPVDWTGRPIRVAGASGQKPS